MGEFELSSLPVSSSSLRERSRHQQRRGTSRVAQKGLRSLLVRFEGYQVFADRQGGVIKVAIKP